MMKSLNHFHFILFMFLNEKHCHTQELNHVLPIFFSVARKKVKNKFFLKVLLFSQKTMRIGTGGC